MTMFDLHYSIAGVTPLSQAGVNYLVSHDGDYHKAIDNGLHISFEDKATLDRVDKWEPIPTAPSGYGEVLDDTLPMSEDPRKDEDCDWDDNPDQSLCDDERIESERAGE